MALSALCSLPDMSAELVQMAGSPQPSEGVCLAYLPFRSSDYTYLLQQGSVDRRASFPRIRSRARTITGRVSPESAWDFRSLDGSAYIGSDAQALQALPQLSEQAVQLSADYTFTALQAALGFDLRERVNRSSKQPLYHVQLLCRGAECQQYSVAEQQDVLQRAQDARAVVTCAPDPASVQLPFTQGTLCGVP